MSVCAVCVNVDVEGQVKFGDGSVRVHVVIRCKDVDCVRTPTQPAS